MKKLMMKSMVASFILAAAPTQIHEQQENIQDALQHPVYENNASYLSKAGKFFCNAEWISPTLGITASHCIDSDTTSMTFTIVKNGQKVNGAAYSLGGPGTLWMQRYDIQASKSLKNDENGLYQDYSLDKYFISRDAAHRDTSPHRFIKLAKLDEIAWKPLNYSQEVSSSKAFIWGYYQAEGKIKAYKMPCHIYRSSKTNEVIFHNCNTTSGLSGSGIYAKIRSDKPYALVAIHSGKKLLNSDVIKNNALSKAFQDILPKKHPILLIPYYNRFTIGVASTVNSMEKFCRQKIEDCDIPTKTSPSLKPGS